MTTTFNNIGMVCKCGSGCFPLFAPVSLRVLAAPAWWENVENSQWWGFFYRIHHKDHARRVVPDTPEFDVVKEKAAKARSALVAKLGPAVGEVVGMYLLPILGRRHMGQEVIWSNMIAADWVRCRLVGQVQAACWEVVHPSWGQTRSP